MKKLFVDVGHGMYVVRITKVYGVHYSKDIAKIIV